MPRTRVILRRNGSKVGEVTYASESEAVAHAAKMQGAASGIEALLAPAAPATNRKRNPMTKRGAVAQVGGLLKRAGVPIYKKATRHEEGRDGVSVRLGFRKGTIDVVSHSRNAAAFMADVVRATEAAGWRVIFDNAAGGAVSLAPPLAKNPSIGRGTKHRDAVAGAVAKRLRAQGIAKKEAVSRGFAIATAAELRTNPTPIDVASLDFGHFKKTVKIAGYYNVRTGRRFARVVSKDGTFVTDVPVADGGKGGSRAKGADAVKRRAYDQLRVHLQPTTWKPSVRVNPAGSVAYGGTTIRIAAGTYTVQPHGPVFNGPGGFVAAKKWIDSHGA